jgi:hypothetical protein
MPAPTPALTPRQIQLLERLKQEEKREGFGTGDPDLDESVQRSFFGETKDDTVGPGKMLLGAGAGMTETGLGIYDTARKHIPGFGSLPDPPEYLRGGLDNQDPWFQAGKFVETAGEMALPASGVRKGVGALIKALPRGQKALGIAGDIAAESAGAGAVVGARTGDLDEAARAAKLAGGITAGTKAVFGTMRQVIPSAERLYKRALPLGKIDAEDVQATIREGLRHGIGMNKIGLEKLKAVSGRLSQEVDAAIQAAGPNQPIDLSHLANRFDEISKEYKLDPDLVKILTGAAGVGKTFGDTIDRLSNVAPLGSKSLPPPGGQPYRITLAEAQGLKKGFQRVFESPEMTAQIYGDRLARKKLALGLREEIERLTQGQVDPKTGASIVPDRNKQLQGIIPLQKALEEFVEKDKTFLRHPWALMTGLAAAGVGEATDNEGAGHGALGVAILLEAMSNPGVLSAAARAGYNTRALRDSLRSFVTQAAPKAGVIADMPEAPRYLKEKQPKPEGNGLPEMPSFGPRSPSAFGESRRRESRQ